MYMLQILIKKMEEHKKIRNPGTMINQKQVVLYLRERNE